MPDARFHARTSTVAGGIAALVASRGQPAPERMLEFIGGIIGGRIGGMAPDRFDPPTSPRHRSLGHGVGSAGALLIWFFQNLERGQKWFRKTAERCEQKLVATRDSASRVWLTLLLFLCRLLTGLCAGVLAGYAAHLTFDAMTPAGLPCIA